MGQMDKIVTVTYSDRFSDVQINLNQSCAISAKQRRYIGFNLNSTRPSST